MLGSFIMFMVGFRTKSFKWWYSLLILFFSVMAVDALLKRLKTQGITVDADYFWYHILLAAGQEIAAFIAGSWLGYALAMRKAMNSLPNPEENQVPPEL